VELLFLTQTYPRVPGDTTGPFIRDLARALVRRGDGVTVLTPHAPEIRPAWDDDGVAVRTFRYAPERFELLGYSRSLAKDERPRPGATLVTPLYLAAAARAVRRVLGETPVDLVHAHWVVPNGPPAAWALRGKRGETVPLAIGLHGSDVFMAEKPLVRSVVGRVLARAELLTGCSPELVDRVAALGFPAERSRVIPYGVDVEQFAPVWEGDGSGAAQWRRELGIHQEATVLLGVGRMATKKGFHVLLDALPTLFGRFADLHVVLAGGGDREEEFRRRTERLPDGGGARVHFPGSVTRDRLPDLYRAADLFTLPAVHDPKGNVDGLPNVILEAMASGLPVVASEISGIPLAVEHHRTGLLVPEKDAGALAGALAELLADPSRGENLGRAGRGKAIARLTWDAVAARYREGYQAALGRTTDDSRPAKETSP
jgi:glycosyltransferase involved in cell wall biosynthesis